MWDIDQLSLRGTPWDSGNTKEFPKLTLAMTERGMMVVKVYMNRPGEKGAQLRLPMPLMEFGVLEQLVERLERETGPGKFTYSLQSNFGPGGYSEVPIIVGKMTVGKDTDGAVYFGINNGPGKPPAIFKFKENYMASLVDEAGEPIALNILSPIKAKAWLRDMTQIKNIWTALKTTEPPPKEGKSYGGGGGNSGGYGSQGNSTFGDDAPY